MADEDRTTQGPEAAAAKFDGDRAADYAVQSRIALAGYDACHETAACLLSAALGHGAAARILVVGIGGSAQEAVTGGRLEPNFHYTGVDPAAPMLDMARRAIDAAGLTSRVTLVHGALDDLRESEPYDAATLIGVLHHLPGDDTKAAILAGISSRLKPGAPFVLACNRHAYTSKPLFLGAWETRWRMHGEREDAIASRLATILKGADPPASDEAVTALLTTAGFESPQLFFSSLFWGGWIARRTA